MASGALPPGFPAVEIDGEYYWDGGLVSNTPLTEVLRDAHHKDALVFQVDLWSASGDAAGGPPRRVRACQRHPVLEPYAGDYEHAGGSSEACTLHQGTARRTCRRTCATGSAFRLAEEAADGSAINVVHLIYKNKAYEGHYKDYEFSIDTMGEHWESGLDDIRASFAHREWFDVPSREQGS